MWNSLLSSRNGRYTMLTRCAMASLAFILIFLPGQAAATDAATISRGEYVKALIETLGIQLQKTDVEALPFEDVDPELAPYVEAALRLDLTNGVSSSKFGPELLISREQAYVMYVRALNLIKQNNASSSFLSAEGYNVSDWAVDALATGRELGLVTETEGRSLKAPLAKKELEQIMSHYQQLDKIVIVHFNDLHGRVLHNEELGEMGLAKISTLIQGIKAKNEHVFLFDMGDTFHGTNYVNLNEGMAVVDVVNRFGIDAMVPGNHEFNYGLERFKEFGELVQFPYLSANIVEDNEPVLEPYIVLEKMGKTFAVVALTASDTPVKTHPDNVEGIEFLDEIETAQSYVNELKDEVDHIIFINHIGYGPDRSMAQKVEGIDVILGGHSHTTLEKPVLVGETYIAQAFEYGKALGVTNLLFQEDQLIGVNGHLIRDDPAIRQDQAVEQILQKYKEEVDKALEEVVGSTDRFLDGERETVRVKESNLGNLIADAMRYMVDAEIGLQNGGGIRANIEAGDITLGDMVAVLPFTNTVVKVEMTGDQLKRTLEHSVSLYPDMNGGFLQVSGIHFTFDPAKPVGNRIVEITVHGEKLDFNKKYTVATNDYMAAGGDGYEWIAAGNILADTGELLSTALINYIKTGPSIPDVEGRIINKENEGSSP